MRQAARLDGDGWAGAGVAVTYTICGIAQFGSIGVQARATIPIKTKALFRNNVAFFKHFDLGNKLESTKLFLNDH